MRFTNILDPIRDELDPAVFDHAAADKPRLKAKHAHWIKSKIYELLESNGYTDVGKWLKLVLTGSLTTYQYSEESDCDVSLFVDSVIFPEWSRGEMIGLMVKNLDGTILPGTTHEMQDFVVAAGIKPHDLYKPGLRSGYDIDANKWVVPPDRSHVHNVEKEENGFYAYALQMADKMERLLKHEPDKAVEFWHQIHKRRQRDQTRGKGDFCLAPQTLVLTDDYAWKKLSEIHIGDTLVGFDEETPGGIQRGKQRTLQRAVVTSLEDKMLPSYRISINPNGNCIVASAQHMWLVRGIKRCLEWRKTEDLKIGDQIVRFGSPWGVAEDQLEAAYLAGLMDGEGHLTATGRICFSQKEGLVMDRAKAAFDALGFRYGVYNKQHLSDYYELASALHVHGGVAETMRFLAQVPAVRLLAQRPDFWIGREISPKGRNVVPGGGIATVEDIEFLGEQEVIAIGTTTRTLIAEGLYSHNSESNIIYKFLSNRGLFPRISEVSGEYIAKIAGPTRLRDKQVSKFVYDPVTNHIIIGPMGREEGENLTHYQLLNALRNQIDVPDAKQTSYGSIHQNGRADVMAEGYPNRFRTEEALRRAIPGVNIPNPQDRLRDEWELEDDPKVIYTGQPPMIQPTETEQPQYAWEF